MLIEVVKITIAYKNKINVVLRRMTKVQREKKRNINSLIIFNNQ